MTRATTVSVAVWHSIFIGSSDCCRTAASNALAVMLSGRGRHSGLPSTCGVARRSPTYESLGAEQSERLEEQCLHALEERLKADLELGLTSELVRELEASRASTRFASDCLAG